MKYKNEQVEEQIDIFDILYPNRKQKREEEVKSNDKASNRRTSVINDIYDYGNYVDSHGHSTKKGISERR